MFVTQYFLCRRRVSIDMKVSPTYIYIDCTRFRIYMHVLVKTTSGNHIHIDIALWCHVNVFLRAATTRNTWRRTFDRCTAPPCILCLDHSNGITITEGLSYTILNFLLLQIELHLKLFHTLILFVQCTATS